VPATRTLQLSFCEHVSLGPPSRRHVEENHPESWKRLPATLEPLPSSEALLGEYAVEQGRASPLASHIVCRRCK
jgi:hypothetical protein